jgi:hypothetical protein
MRKTIVLSGLIALVAGCLVQWPSPSYSASKGRAAAAPSGKSTVSPPSSAVGKTPKYFDLRLNRVQVNKVQYGKRKPKGRPSLQDLPGTKDVNKASARRKR